jgi:hypothetical protein
MGSAYETVIVKPFCDRPLWNVFTGENITLASSFTEVGCVQFYESGNEQFTLKAWNR